MKNEFRTYASLLAAQQSDVDIVAAWMADREMEQRARESKVTATRQDNELLSKACGPYDPQIAKGQIRILSKQYTTDPDTIPYVAVVDEWDIGFWLIIPFSPYKTPAVPGEMVTGMDVYGLNVLQVWNGRTMQDFLLQKSFLFGTLPEDVRMDALALFRHELGGVALPDSFKAQRGTPIVVSSDPRREYLAESIERLQPLTDAVVTEFEREDDMDHESSPLDHEALLRIWQTHELHEYRLAAATADENPEVPLILHPDNWMGHCKEVSGFTSFYEGDSPRKVVFILDEEAPKKIVDASSMRVEAYHRDTRKFVGHGILENDGDKLMAIVDMENAGKSVRIDTAEQIVLILVEKK